MAELPTWKKTLQADAPLVKLMELPVSVRSVDPAWKTNIAAGSPWALRVSEPPISSEDAELYTPGPNVWPAPMNMGTLVAGVSPAAVLYAVVRSDWAIAATVVAAWMVPPVTTPGGNPVTAVPGLTPTSPLMRLRPVLVTVVPAITAKLLAVPRPTGVTAAPAVEFIARSTPRTVASTSDTANQE